MLCHIYIFITWYIFILIWTVVSYTPTERMVEMSLHFRGICRHINCMIQVNPEFELVLTIIMKIGSIIPWLKKKKENKRNTEISSIKEINEWGPAIKLSPSMCRTIYSDSLLQPSQVFYIELFLGSKVISIPRLDSEKI